MVCLICGNPTLSKGTLVHITKINSKKAKIDKKIPSVFTSDPNLALELIIKSKRYAEEIKNLETFSNASRQLLCDNCYNEVKRSVKGNDTGENNESEYSKSKEIIRAFKVYSFMLQKTLSELYTIGHPSDEEDFHNLTTKIDEMAEGIRINISVPVHWEYYEARLFYLLGYYNEALLCFQRLLNELKKIDDMLGNSSEEELADYINSINERKNEIQEMINEIKERSGLD
jgi:hypothetical protein